MISPGWGRLGLASAGGMMPFEIALKGEAMGLAIMTELPLVIGSSPRGGP